MDIEDFVEICRYDIIAGLGQAISLDATPMDVCRAEHGGLGTEELNESIAVLQAGLSFLRSHYKEDVTEDFIHSLYEALGLHADTVTVNEIMVAAKAVENDVPVVQACTMFTCVGGINLRDASELIVSLLWLNKYLWNHNVMYYLKQDEYNDYVMAASGSEVSFQNYILNHLTVCDLISEIAAVKRFQECGGTLEEIPTRVRHKFMEREDVDECYCDLLTTSDIVDMNHIEVLMSTASDVEQRVWDDVEDINYIINSITDLEVAKLILKRRTL